MKITIHDVAKRAGVSTKTVSRVVNQQGEISPETRARVQAVIEELGYRPNILARSLVNQRSAMIGVVAWGLDFYAPSRIVVGIQQRANETGYSLFLHLVPHPVDSNAEQIINTLADHRVDGIIWMVPEVNDNHNWVQAAQLSNLPPIVQMSAKPRSGLDTVAVDNYRGGYLAAGCLLESGRRKIGMIAGSAGWWESEQRRAGWHERLEQAGLDPREMPLVEAGWSVESGAQAMLKLLKQAHDLDAVLTASDDIALGALSVACQHHLQIPGDLALVGFDNIPQSAYFQPPLTTIDQPLARSGQAAVDLLLKRIERRGSDEMIERSTIMLEPRLVVRASSG